MAKRKNGEGTWGKKNIKGTTYVFYRDSNQKYTYGKTEKEVKEKIKKKSEKQKQLEHIDNKTTFGEYIQNWLLTKKSSIEDSTYDCYETMIQSQIIKFRDFDLGNVQLQNLSSNIFQKYLDALATKYSRATIHKIWVIIKECVKYGEIHEELPYNTTKLVNVPKESSCKVKRKEVPFLSIEDANKLYEVSNEKFSNGELIYGSNAKTIVLIMYTGVRVSEIVALKWKNVDLDNKIIRIKESTSERKNRNQDGNSYIKYDKTTKTNNERTIPLPERAIEAIRWFDKQNPNHKQNDYVCLSSDGTQINRRNINRTLKSMAVRANCSVQDFSVHSLRHTYGSILLSQGVEIKKVSELLGHADISTTYNVYIGILEKDKASEVERVFN